MPPVSPNSEPTPIVPTPETPLTITGKPEDAVMLQQAAESARNVSGVEQNPSPIVPGTEITVPEFAQPPVTEASQSAEASAPIEVPPALAGPSPLPTPEVPQAPVSSETVPPAPTTPELPQ